MKMLALLLLGVALFAASAPVASACEGGGCVVAQGAMLVFGAPVAFACDGSCTVVADGQCSSC
jgi:hypothetical protein